MPTAPRAAELAEPDALSSWLQDRDEALREAAFEVLIRRHGAAIRRACRGHERDPQRCEELVQDVLVNLWRALPGFEGRASLKTFVLRVTHNVALSHVGRAARDPVVPVEHLTPAAAGVPGADRQLDRARQRARLLAAVQALPPADRTLVLLWLEGLSTAELAHATGLSATNCTSRLFRLRRRLARDLEAA